MRIEDLNESKVAEILTWLATTDDQFAELKGGLESAEILRKRVRARAWLDADGTGAERTAEAEVADDTQAADDAYIAAKVAYEKLKARRERAALLIDTWRSLEASRRRVMA